MLPLPKAKINTTRIIVSKKRSFEAARQYNGHETCVLNFASATNPGGCVAWESTAQEESLFRCSTLYFNLMVKENWEHFYMSHRQQNNPLYNDDCIYTPDVLVFKTDTRFPELLDQKDWMYVNVITCAAPNLRTDRDGTEHITLSNSELEMLQYGQDKRTGIRVDTAVDDTDVLRVEQIEANPGGDTKIVGLFCQRNKFCHVDHLCS